MSVETPTTKVRQWLRQELEGQSQARLPELADAAVQHFAEDKLFVRGFLVTHLRPIIYDLAQKVMAETRGREAVILAGDTLITKDEITKKGKQLQSKWTRWMEHVGDRHIRLMDMTRDDLRQAAIERRKRGDAEYHRAALWEALADRMEGDQTVGELFEPEHIEKVERSLMMQEVPV